MVASVSRRRKHRTARELLILVVCLALPATAEAATVSLNEGGDSLTYRAGGGEANDLTGGGFESATFSESSVPVAAGRGCTQIAVSAAECGGLAAVTTVDVRLRDLDDRARLSYFNVANTNVFGGRGVDDIAATGNRIVSLHGGAGNDRLVSDSVAGTANAYGGAGDDWLLIHGEPDGDAVGGEGDDTIVLRGNLPTAYGGGGHDDISFENPTTGLSVPTLNGDAGPDTLTVKIGGTEITTIRATIVGGAGDDQISVVALVPAGGGSTSSILAGAGDDTITSAIGDSQIDAGQGADVIDARGSGSDLISCGPGRDVVRADPTDTVLPDCERVTRA
jgi:hypothetical protein